MTEQHHPLCNEGVQAGDQTVPCNCPDGWPKVDPLHQQAEALAKELNKLPDCSRQTGDEPRVCENCGTAIPVILAALQRVQAETLKPTEAAEAERTYYGKALDLVADELTTLKVEEFEARRWKIITILRHAAYDTVTREAETREEADELRAMLLEYGNHLPGCSIRYRTNPECDCGFEQKSADLARKDRP